MMILINVNDIVKLYSLDLQQDYHLNQSISYLTNQPFLNKRVISIDIIIHLIELVYVLVYYP